jgi:CRISPR-associated endonuclease/helicase Cas3
MVAAGRPWAKSGTAGPLEFAGGVAFRHELASLLLIDGPLRSLLAASPDADLTRYLVLAHHGRLRVRVSDHSVSNHRGEPAAANPCILGLAQGATSDIPPLLGQPAATLTVDLGQFGQDDFRQDEVHQEDVRQDDRRSWTATVAGLLDRYGPFTLAYLETVVRVADWRASGGRELPEPVAPRPRSG